MEGKSIVPPGTNIALSDEVEATAEVCQDALFVTPSHVEVKRCVMHEDHWSDDQCENHAVDGSDFCAEHIGVKLCKASGIQWSSSHQACSVLQ